MSRTFPCFVINSCTISAVRSVEWSFTTMISVISGCRTSDSTHAAIATSSSRAGTIAEILRGPVTWTVLLDYASFHPLPHLVLILRNGPRQRGYSQQIHYAIIT